MKKGHVGHLLATWRELDDDMRARVESHLSTCVECRALRQAFREEDLLLDSLPTVRPSPRWQKAVRARIHASHRRRPLPLTRQAGLLAAVLIVCIAMSVGTVTASARALPGDLLYPVKRTVEQIELLVIRDNDREAEYLRQLAQRRREEARRVLELKRRVSLEFAGVLHRAENGQWTVGGIPVQIDPEAAANAGVQPGDLVEIRGIAAGGEMQVLRITEGSGLPKARPSPVPVLTVTPTLEPPATATEAERTPEARTTPTQTATRMRPTSTSTRLPTARETTTRTPWPNVRPSRTPTSTAIPLSTRTPAVNIQPGMTRTHTPAPGHTRPVKRPTRTAQTSTPEATATAPDPAATISLGGTSTPMPTDTSTPSTPPAETPPTSNVAPTPTPKETLPPPAETPPTSNVAPTPTPGGTHVGATPGIGVLPSSTPAARPTRK